jgi:membrane-bound lytic murein transglycosylase D
MTVSCQSPKKTLTENLRQVISEPYSSTIKGPYPSSAIRNLNDEPFESPLINGQNLEPLICWDSAYYQSWEKWQTDTWSQQMGRHRLKHSQKVYRQKVFRQEKFSQELQKLIASQHYDFPVELQPTTIQWIEYFLTRGRKEFVTWLRRAEDVKDIIVPILESYGLPKDLLYLAMIESGFQTRALSVASALGPWQFINSTGQIYGLKTGQLYDERLDLMRSTHAASKFFLDLYKEFQNWHLAVAGYNAGQRRISRAIRRGGSRNFFVLSAKKLIPRETRNYVPKIQAAMILSKNARAFGFDTVQGNYHPETILIPVSKAIALEDLAKATNMSPALLKNLNPSLRAGFTPPLSSGLNFHLTVPKKYAQQVLKSLDHIPESNLQVDLSLKLKQTQRLDRLAKQAGLNLKTLLQLNPQYKSWSWVKRNRVLKIRLNLGHKSSDRALKYFKH